ncbi:TetR/AcrR family transcriptional regulator [Sphingopyxis sp. 113P3]|uniref:TetR/AcrR family transcriptional regulator n=2 Tax=Sphingopyxis TaxID=165697 RepID=UPI0006AD1370|nr:TetR/AcrR family transcriptional regulator [Sphingopyxis sp. 113P3]
MADVLLHGLAAQRVDLTNAAAAIPTPFVSTDKLSQDSFLRAATDLINDHGYRGASVDRISATLKVTKGAFYHHNETRDQLVVACFERTFDIVREAQNLAMAEEMDGLSHVAAASVSLVSRQMLPEGALLRTSALTAVGPELRMEMQRKLTLSTYRFADMLNDGLVDGSVRLCDMRVASEMVTGMVNSAQELQRWVPSASVENAAQYYVWPLFYGFLAE